jgi:3-dehydroquinate synthase
MLSRIVSGDNPVYSDSEGVVGLFEVLKVLPTYSSLHVLVDSNTAANCLPVLERSGVLKNASIHVVEAGEGSKSLASSAHLIDRLSQSGADRSALLLNLGGGMVCDLGGFVASIFMRGIRHINIPTSLMAMVDAAIGGKTAVNHSGIKNLVGAFHMPEAVFISSVFLKTLAYRELRSGFAEVIKHALIGAGPQLSELGHPIEAVSSSWDEIIAASVRFKSSVVASDPTDRSFRRILNFGHTIGHVVESISLENGGLPLSHGESVALGMMVETVLSHRLNGLDEESMLNILGLLRRHYPDLALPPMSEEWIRLLQGDKKSDSGTFRFVLLSEIGRPEIEQKVDIRQIMGAVEALSVLERRVSSHP